MPPEPGAAQQARESTPHRRSTSRRKRSRKGRWKLLLIALLLLLLALAGAAVWLLDSAGVAPRAMGPYIYKRASGHNPTIVGLGRWGEQTLVANDRGASPLPPVYAPRPDTAEALPAPLRSVPVSSSAQLLAAIAAAQPGDHITIAPGTYLLTGSAIALSRPGAPGQPIVVRAERPGSVQLDFSLTEGMHVTAPYWRIENLSIRGACASHYQCEHAFHVVGRGHHFTALNNTITDFNSHFKINALKGEFPDHGLIAGNTISNTEARQTDSSVTLVDLVAASGWVVRGNRISDFVKLGGDHISYGGFFKGAGKGNVFERNVVVCEERLRAPGQRVGLSLGGGGTGKEYCRDSRCIVEQEEGVVRANLVASCSDEGIYLNSAARSKVEHNTVIDTAGIIVRFATSSADVEGNLVDGAIRSRQGGVLRQLDNKDTALVQLYLGMHPVRALLAGGTFDWTSAPPRRDRAAPGLDLCGAKRPATPTYGAFESFAACKP